MIGFGLGGRIREVWILPWNHSSPFRVCVAVTVVKLNRAGTKVRSMVDGIDSLHELSVVPTVWELEME